MNPVFTNNFDKFLETLITGKVCVFETDTVVGLGCNVWCIDNNDKCIINNTGLKSIYQIKGRNFDKPISWLISGQQQFNKYVQQPYPKYVNKHIDNMWPGACTLVVKANKNVPDKFAGHLNNTKTIGLRVPNVDFIINAIKLSNSPIACTSANISEKNPVNKIEDTDKKILDQVDLIYKDKNFVPYKNKSASCVINCTKSTPQTLRQ